MSEALERLQAIGAQKIYEDTHIPVEHVQAILHKSFDNFSKVQFLGFISILEREYNEDLSDLRSEGLKNFDTEEELPEVEGVFVVPARKKNFTYLYISLALIIFIVVAYLNISSTQPAPEVPEVDNTLIIDAQKNLDLPDVNESDLVEDDLNNSQEDMNASVLDENATEVAPIEEVEVVKSLKFVTKTKLWLGYIDVKTNKHYNKIFTGEFELDPEKEWLLVFGHKFVDIALNDELISVNSKNSLRFLYKDGVIKEISTYEFKQLNRGRTW